MQTLIASIFVFGILIFAHELGHYLAARVNGIKVLELAIGFGPRIIGWKRKDVDYSWRLFPLGGFVRLLGENPNEAGTPDSFARKALWRRATVLLAGATMNLLLSLVLFFIIFFFMLGVPRTDLPLVGAITPGMPAGQAGLQAGDEIVMIDGQPINNWDDVVANIEKRPGEEITLVLKRGEAIFEAAVVPKLIPQTGRGMIGIAPPVQKYDLAGSFSLSISRFATILLSMYQVLTGRMPLDIAGPVGIIIIVGEAAATGFINLLMLAAVISISLGIINLLPIPALDGGRLLFLAIEGIRGRPVDPEKEGFVHFIGFALLILLILFVTYHDLIRWDLLPR